MSFKKYLLDKSIQIFITISGFIITILLLNAFKVERDLILVISIIFITKYHKEPKKQTEHKTNVQSDTKDVSVFKK